MSCKFCPLGCPINNKHNCCYECEEQSKCDEGCNGMPEEYKDCNYYVDMANYERS